MKKKVKIKTGKEVIDERMDIIEKIGCNYETSTKKIEFKNEEQRKRMAQDFYR